jgi:hypothetical protein
MLKLEHVVVVVVVVVVNINFLMITSQIVSITDYVIPTADGVQDMKH